MSGLTWGAGRRRPLPTTLTLRAAAAITVLLALLAGALVAAATALDLFAGTARSASDQLWPSGDADDRVVVVGIDAASLARTGEAWPWPRDLQAELVDRLTEAGAAAVVLDVVYAPSRPGDDVLAAALARNGRAVVAASADRVSAGSVVSGDTRLRGLETFTPPEAAIAGAASAVASAVVRADADGTVRRVPLLLERPDGGLVPSLALAAADQLDGSVGTAILRPGAVRIDDLDIPVDHEGELTVAWNDRLRSSAQVVSAADVLDGRLGLAGKVVLVGVTDPALGDRYVVPSTSTGLPGVVVQANVLTTILTRNWVEEAPAWVAWTQVTLLAAALVWCALRLRLRWLVLGVPLAVVVGLVTGVAGFTLRGWLPDFVRPPVATLLALAAAVAVRSLSEAKARAHVDGLFRRYVPDAVADQLVSRGLVEQARAGQRLRVAVLFCDLRGFTPMAASCTPAEVREILDGYYELVCGEVFARSGTVMQFVGDEVFAVFGAPLPLPDAGQAALDCALAVQRGAEGLRRALVARGLAPVRFGIGLHAGEVVAAHVGPETRRQYAVVGDPVNLGSRLCGAALADTVVVSRDLLDGLREVPAGTADEVALKGVARPVAVLRLP